MEPAIAAKLREGFWRMVQRISLGIPGFVGTGEISGIDKDQFNGGLAGMRTAWPLAPYNTPLYEAIPIAGFYTLGMHWPAILREAGVLTGKNDNFDKVIARLEKEFGRATKKSLLKGTIPVPRRRKKNAAALGDPPERTDRIVPGEQWDATIDGVRFQIYFARHFVDRYYNDEESRPAVGRFIDLDTINRVIFNALPRIKEMIESEGVAEGILVSDENGLSMKFFSVPTRDGWRLSFVTLIVGAPLYRTSDREVMIKVNPIVPVLFDREILPDLQTAVIAEILPDLGDLEIGDVEHLGGEIARAIVERTDEGFEISDAEWAAEFEPLPA